MTQPDILDVVSGFGPTEVEALTLARRRLQDIRETRDETLRAVRAFFPDESEDELHALGLTAADDREETQVQSHVAELIAKAQYRSWLSCQNSRLN